MDTCVRGFSFMPDTKVEVADLEYISGGELERTWKATRRQRLKDQERRVWDQFVKEQDIVKSLYKDDPYQFLHELPESCLKELMDAELQKARKEVEDEKTLLKEVPLQGSGDFQREECAHTVTFAEEPDDCDMFHIFDDDKDELSGADDEPMNQSPGSPCTVRERDSENNSPVRREREQNSSPENVSNVIESSIYCAKVKDLRLNIQNEMLAIMAALERQDVMTVEREQVARTCRRAAEFSARFARIHMYQLQRQMADVKRNTLHSLPFAKHTHYHAQMVRVASLHHNLLQALQVFHKSVQQTACVRQSAATLHSLGLAAREVTALCAAVPAPRDLAAARGLYADALPATCDALDEAVCEHSLRVADFLSTTDNTSRSPSRKSKGKGKRRMHGLPTKSIKSIPDTEARLSMYSLDNLRLNLNATSSGTSKLRGQGSAGGKPPPKERRQKSPRRSPRSRRPLMRAGGAGGAAGRGGRGRPPSLNDTEITTMVEAVETCTSSRMSREPSPRGAGHTRRSAAATPRAPNAPSAPSAPTPGSRRTPRIQTTTPRQKTRTLSPNKIRRGSPKPSPRPHALGGDAHAEHADIIHAKRDPLLTRKDLNITKRVNGTKPDKTAHNIDKIPKDVHRERTDKTVSSKVVDSGRVDDTTKLESVKGFDSARDLEIGKSVKDDSGKALGSGKIGKKPDSAKSLGNAKIGKEFDSGKSLGPSKTIKDFDSIKDLGSGKSINDYDSAKDFGSGKSVKDFDSGKSGQDFDSGKSGKDFDTTASNSKDGKEVSGRSGDSPRSSRREEDRESYRSDRDRRMSSMAPAHCEVTRLLKQLCSGDGSGNRNERVSGAKNAQLLCVSGGSPRQPSTPQLLRILEETIQKKAPRPMYESPSRNPEQFRMTFNIPAATADSLFHYRTKFVQHMLASSLYANSAVGKPWEMIGSVSDKIIDEVLAGCAREMEVRDQLRQLYASETR